MYFRSLIVLLLVAMTSTVSAQPTTLAALRDQVEAAERAFADTMRRRDFDAFQQFIAEEAVFFAGDKPLRGRDTVASAWQPFFAKEDAPFSWEPTVIEVLESGSLAISSGPVRDPNGQQIGIFNSIWRRNSDDSWQVIFDRGADYCP